MCADLDAIQHLVDTAETYPSTSPLGGAARSALWRTHIPVLVAEVAWHRAQYGRSALRAAESPPAGYAASP